jgi:predicted porin
VKLNKKLALAVASAVLSISSSAFAAVDFLNDDAPFKTDINIAGHNGDVQLYGIIDIGYMTVNHSLPYNKNLPNNLYPYSYDAATGSSASAPVNVSRQSNFINGGMQDSRFGLKGGIDLFGAGDTKFKVIYQLEAGFNPLNGSLNDATKALAANSTGNCATAKTCTVYADSSLNGDLFARQAWAGIDAGYLGKVTYGIQYNPFYEITGKYDPNQKSDSFSPLGESGAIGGGGGISENARMKNSLKYANSFDVPAVLGEKAKLNVAGMYQFGNDVDTDHGRGYALQAGYETSMIGFQVAYNNFTDTVKADVGTAAATPVKFGLYNSDATLVALKFTPTKEVNFSGGYQWITLNKPDDTSLGYGSIFGYTPTTTGGVVGADWGNNSSKSVSASNGDKQDIDFWWVGGEYNFGERFKALDGLTLSAAYYKTDYGTMTSANKDWYIDTETAILDYKLNKRFDIYGAATWNQFRGNYVNAANMLYKDIDAYGLGVRMKF